jgi:hypothetical protein
MDLQKLILECGERFRWLKNKSQGSRSLWLAQARSITVGIPDIKIYADSPEAAVLGLLAVLNS